MTIEPINKAADLQTQLDTLRAAAQAYWDVSDALMIDGDYGMCCMYCGAFWGKTHDEDCKFGAAEKHLLALLS